MGVTFASTIVTHGMAGRMADHRGSKHTMVRGLRAYAAASLICMGANRPGLAVRVAYAVLILGRLLNFRFCCCRTPHFYGALGQAAMVPHLGRLLSPH